MQLSWLVTNNRHACLPCPRVLPCCPPLAHPPLSLLILTRATLLLIVIKESTHGSNNKQKLFSSPQLVINSFPIPPTLSSLLITYNNQSLVPNPSPTSLVDTQTTPPALQLPTFVQVQPISDFYRDRDQRIQRHTLLSTRTFFLQRKTQIDLNV